MKNLVRGTVLIKMADPLEPLEGTDIEYLKAILQTLVRLHDKLQDIDNRLERFEDKNW